MRLSIFAALVTALFCFCPTACANAVYNAVRAAVDSGEMKITDIVRNNGHSAKKPRK